MNTCWKCDTPDRCLSAEVCYAMNGEGEMTAEQFFNGNDCGHAITYEFDDAQREHIFKFAEAYAAPFCDQLAEREAQYQKAMRALESLTCHGSEYVGDVERCVKFIEDAREMEHRGMIMWAKRAHEAESREQRLREALRAAMANIYRPSITPDVWKQWEETLTEPKGRDQSKTAPPSNSETSA